MEHHTNNSNTEIRQSPLAQELAKKNFGYTKHGPSEEEIRTAAENNIFIFESLDQLIEIANKDINEWPPLLRKNGVKMQMHIPPGTHQQDLDKVMAKIEEKQIKYLSRVSSPNVAQAQSELGNLGKEVVTKHTAKKLDSVSQKYKEAAKFLADNPTLLGDLFTTITNLENAPTKGPHVDTYKSAISLFKNHIRTSLIVELADVPREQREARTRKRIAEWERGIYKMAGGDKTIEYSDILVDEKGAPPEIRMMVRDIAFLKDVNKIFESGDPRGAAEKWLKKYAECSAAIGIVNAESATRFAKESRSIIIQLIGNNDMTLDQARDFWEELSRDKHVGALIDPSAVEDFENAALADLEKVLNMDKDAIVRLYNEERNQRKREMSRANSNPFNSAMRNFGGMFEAATYGGYQWLQGVVLIGLALANFNPLAFINPVTIVAGIGTAAVAHKLGAFRKPPTIEEKAQKQDFIVEMRNMPDSDVKTWLMTLDMNDALREKLEKNAKTRMITSKEIKACFPDKKETAFSDLPKIATNTPQGQADARKLFTALKACNTHKVKPKDIFDHV